jgi:tetratricopeptide (TPR) repeat protein
LLHVLITPPPSLRALLTSLTALSAARDPRLAVTAALPADADLDHRRLVDPAAWPGRPPRLVRTDEGDDPLAAAELEPGSVVLILKAGAVPPRGWTETLLAHARDAGPRVCAVAAEAWERPDSGPLGAVDLRRWTEADRLARRSWYHLHEDRPQSQAPLLALLRPAERRRELSAWWRDGCLRELHLADPDDSTARLLVAKDLRVLDTEPQAPHLRASLGRFVPERGEAYPTELAEVRRRRRELRAFVSEAPAPAASLELAHLALATGDRDEAAVQARVCLDSWPDCAEAKLLLARSLTGDGHLAGAQRLLEELLDSGPLEPFVRAGIFATLASYWLHRGDPRQAQPCVDTALAIDSQHPVARYARARLLLAVGAFDRALADLEATTRRVPLVPDMWYELGRTRLLAGRELAGRQALARALELDPEHDRAGALLDRLDPLPEEPARDEPAGQQGRQSQHDDAHA